MYHVQLFTMVNKTLKYHVQVQLSTVYYGKLRPLCIMYSRLLLKIRPLSITYILFTMVNKTLSITYRSIFQCLVPQKLLQYQSSGHVLTIHQLIWQIVNVLAIIRIILLLDSYIHKYTHNYQPKFSFNVPNYNYKYTPQPKFSQCTKEYFTGLIIQPINQFL